MKLIISLLGLFLFVPAVSMAADFSVAVDHTTLGRDHTFELTARLEGSSDDFTLDIAALTKNFYVTSERDMQRAGLWREKRYRLGAKRKGVLKVPALVVIFHGKKLMSQPFSIKVLSTDGEVDDVHLWVEDKVSRKQAWLRQQLLWQVTVFSTYPFADTPDIHLPLFDGFDVRKVDAAVPGERVMDGRRLFSMSWHVLLFPLHTGDLNIARPEVSARLLQMVKTHRFAAGNPNFDAGEKHVHTKKALGSELRIDVRALPLAAANLPVGHLALVSDIPDKHAYVAAPLTWNIHLTGKEIRRVDMPDLQKRLLLNGSFTVVREKPLVSMRKDGYHMRVNALYRIVLTPSAQGELRLPGVDLAFFNPDNGRIEHTSFAPRLLTVLPQRKLAQNEGFDVDGAGASAQVQARGGNDASIDWKALAIGMFILWLCTLAAWALFGRTSLTTRHVLSRRKWMRVTPSLRRAIAARDAEEQFTAIKDALGLSKNMTPLGLLAYAPDLCGGETSTWLEALERARWQGGDKPQPQDGPCVQNMVRIIMVSAQDGSDMMAEACDSAAFGRIGG